VTKNLSETNGIYGISQRGRRRFTKKKGSGSGGRGSKGLGPRLKCTYETLEVVLYRRKITKTMEERGGKEHNVGGLRGERNTSSIRISGKRG